MNFNKKILLRMSKILTPNDSINDLLKELELRLSEGQFKDSVQKIKFMVTKETVERLVHEN